MDIRSQPRDRRLGGELVEDHHVVDDLERRDQLRTERSRDEGAANCVMGLKRIVAITNPENRSSIRLLEKLGLKFDRMIRATADGPEIRLFVWDSPER